MSTRNKKGKTEKKSNKRSKGDAETPKLTLVYFNGRARGEVTRLLLSDAKTPFEDVRIEISAWPESAWKPRAPFGQLPLLEVDGQLLAQSSAIEHFVARLTGLASEDSMVSAQIDMVIEGVKDVSKDFSEAVWTQDEKSKKTKMDEFFAKSLPKWGTCLERMLKSNDGGSGYFIGDAATLADFTFFGCFENILMAKSDALASLPLLDQLMKRFAARPHIAEYLSKRVKTEW